MTTYSRTSQVSPFGRLLTIRRRHFDFAALELPVTRLAIFFSVYPALRPAEVFFTYSDILFCFSAVLLLLSGRLRFTPLGPLTVPWMLAFAVLSCGLIVSSLLGNAPERVLVVLGQYAFAYILLAYILVRTDESIIDTFIKTFVLGTVCLNAYGLAVYFTGEDETFRFVTGSGRLTSFMGNPNANANVIALTLPLLMYLWFARKWRRIYVLASFAILAYALVATSSVGGLLWSMAGVGVFIALTINWRVLVGLAVCLAVAIPLLEKYGPAVLPATFQVRVLEALQSGDMGHAGTFNYRMGLIHEALDVVDDSLLVGLGADQYRAESDSGAPVHDVYLLLWAEGGLPALIGWLMLPQIIALTALWVLGHPGGRLLTATTLAVIAVFLLAATGNSHMYGRFWVVPLHLSTALLMVSWARYHRRVTNAPAPRRGPGAAAGQAPLRADAPAPAMRPPR
jgi:O-antigen ligase